MKLDPGVLTLVNVAFTGLNTLLLVGLLLREDAPAQAVEVAPGGMVAATGISNDAGVATVASSGSTTEGTPPPGTDPLGVPASGTPASGTPASGTPASGTAASGTTMAADAVPGAPASGFSEVEAFLASTKTPLANAAAELKKQVKMPSDAEVAACVGSNDLTSPACSVVITLLKRGYAETGMPFPSLPEHGATNAPSGLTPSSPTGLAPSGQAPTSVDGTVPASTAPAGTAPSGAPGATPTRSTGALRVYLDTLTARARGAVVAAGGDATGVLPTAEALDAAVATGALDSPESKRVIDQLRAAHQKYGLKFTEPTVSASTAGGGRAAQP